MISDIQFPINDPLSHRYSYCMQSASDLFQNPGLEKVHDIAAHKDIISSAEFSPDGSKVGSPNTHQSTDIRACMLHCSIFIPNRN